MRCTLFGPKVLDVGCLIAKDPNHTPDNKHHIKVPGEDSWNLISLAFRPWELRMETKLMRMS